MGEEAVLTFGCATVIEREGWTEAFRILNQLAPAFVGSQVVATPIKGKLIFLYFVQPCCCVDLGVF